MASSLFGQTMSSPAQSPITAQPAVNPQLQQMKNMMNLLRSGGNPQAMVQNMIRQSPQGSAVMSIIQQHGGDARAAFYDLAKQKGVDPNQILGMLQ